MKGQVQEKVLKTQREDFSFLCLFCEFSVFVLICFLVFFVFFTRFYKNLQIHISVDLISASEI